MNNKNDNNMPNEKRFESEVSDEEKMPQTQKNLKKH